MSYLEKCKEDVNIRPLKFILLDLMMPLMDGFDFLEEYERYYYPVYPQLPLIVISSTLNSADKNRVLSFPFVTKFVEKPFSRSIVQAYL
ncbi:response regulator [Chondrinema litorale]|uniref:response regulator n=1 Tax=Chondrinema litorale TaxID=2994555 RepID=UPI00254309BE|nr:response regulator [Chondrinema litorale]UZR98562.1 response regulator [Chondrinema litorale]